MFATKHLGDDGLARGAALDLEAMNLGIVETWVVIIVIVEIGTGGAVVGCFVKGLRVTLLLSASITNGTVEAKVGVESSVRNGINVDEVGVEAAGLRLIILPLDAAPQLGSKVK